MGLPGPPELLDPGIFYFEEADEAQARLQRQLNVFTMIDGRGVGRAAFDAVDGWQDLIRTAVEEKRLVKACAEWADGELVAAHVAYQNDILCTDDRAVAAGTSIFNAENRSWLASEFGVVFQSISELASFLS